MHEKEVAAAAEERRRRQLGLLSKFEEIAQTFLNTLNGERGNADVFASLQNYLDGYEFIDGAYCKRRTVLLAVHDIEEGVEAPAPLQKKTLSKLELLNILPVPPVSDYRDIATAILRMEVVVRLEAMQALVETTDVLDLNKSAPGSAGRLSPASGQTASFEPARKAPRHIPN